MSKLYDHLDLDNTSHKIVYDINKANELKYGEYHNECSLFAQFCRCKKIKEKDEQSR